MKRIGLDISVLNDKNKTGIAVYTYNLIKNILEQDTENKYVLFGISTLATKDYLKNIEFKKFKNVEIKVVSIPAKFFRRAFLFWQKMGILNIEKFIGNVDVFNSFNWYLPPQKRGKVFATVCDLTSIDYPQWHDPRTTQLDTIRLERIAKEADTVITISESSKTDLLKKYPKLKIEVVYPSVSDIFNSKKEKDDQKLLSKYGLESGEYFISVATLEPRKNIEFLIDAFAASGISRKLVLVGGKGWKDEKLAEVIKKHGDNIVLTGFVSDEDLVVLYRNALSLVYPSLFEGFGIPILEGMKSGIPVITSDISSMPEAGGDAVYYIDPKRQETLVKALKEIEKDDGLRKELIEKGFEQVKKFSWEKSAKQMIDLYNA